MYSIIATILVTDKRLKPHKFEWQGTVLISYTSPLSLTYLCSLIHSRRLVQYSDTFLDGIRPVDGNPKIYHTDVNLFENNSYLADCY